MYIGTFRPYVSLGCSVKGLGQKVQAVECIGYRLEPLKILEKRFALKLMLLKTKKK